MKCWNSAFNARGFETNYSSYIVRRSENLCSSSGGAQEKGKTGWNSGWNSGFWYCIFLTLRLTLVFSWGLAEVCGFLLSPWSCDLYNWQVLLLTDWLTGPPSTLHHATHQSKGKLQTQEHIRFTRQRRPYLDGMKFDLHREKILNTFCMAQMISEMAVDRILLRFSFSVHKQTTTQKAYQ